MSWRLWEMLPLEALRIDHISWSSVLSATWDQTLSHLASPRNHSLHFRYFQRRRGLLQVAAFKALKMDEVSQHKEKQWERERHHFLWNIWKLKRLFQNFSHNLQLFHIVSSLVAEICKWGKCIGRSVFLIHYVPAYVTLSHNCTNVKYGCNSFFSMLSFTKPVLHPLVRCRWLVALQFLPCNEPSTGCVPWHSKEPQKLSREKLLQWLLFGFVWWDF